MNNNIDKFIDELSLPQSVREEVKKKYAGNPLIIPEITETKKMIKMSSEDGRKVTIVLWKNDSVSVISTDKKGEPHISTTNSPEVFYIAQKHYIDLGLVMDYAEEDSKRIGAG